METAKIANMYDLNETIAKDLFEGKTYPWEVLSEIGDFILKLGPTLDSNVFEKRGEDRLIHQDGIVVDWIHGIGVGDLKQERVAARSRHP